MSHATDLKQLLLRAFRRPRDAGPRIHSAEPGTPVLWRLSSFDLMSGLDTEDFRETSSDQTLGRGSEAVGRRG